MTIIETIECTPNEETAFRIADECCTRMQTLYDMEGREFTREHYIVYFTYFVFVENAAVALTPKIIDTMENILAQRVGRGDRIDTFAAKRIAVDYMRRFTDLCGEESEFGTQEGSKSPLNLVQLTIDIFNTANDRFNNARE